MIVTAYTACEFPFLLSLRTPAIRLSDESAVEQFLGSLDMNKIFADDFDDLELKAFFLKTIQVNPTERSSAAELLEVSCSCCLVASTHDVCSTTTSFKLLALERRGWRRSACNSWLSLGLVTGFLAGCICILV